VVTIIPLARIGHVGAYASLLHLAALAIVSQRVSWQPRFVLIGARFFA
jgi:hypothetical protein